MTEKNTLKNWFKTGAKPTQEQFWNWQDSYWHKTDTIPQAQIQGLDTTLANKAETSALDAKANADSSGLTAENIISWKKALGVGELPKNIATIDKDSEQGNAYTKPQVDTELSKKIDKPTEEGTTTTHPYVVGVDADGNSAKLPAGDLGKNSANSDLETTGNRTFTQKHIYTYATAGFPYYVTGLPNKSADTTFSRVRVQDANGQEAWSNGKNILLSMPTMMSERERLTYLRQMAGDNSLNLTTINDILERVVVKSNTLQQIIMVGSNFNFAPNESSIYLINDSGDININYTIISPISIALDIPSSVPVGEYRVKIITNKLQAIISTQSFIILDSDRVENIDLSNLRWTNAKNPNNTTDITLYDSIASGNRVISNEFKKGNTKVPDAGNIECYKSSELPNITMADNFVINGRFQCESENYGVNATSYFGITFNNSDLSYMSIPDIYISLFEHFNYSKRFSSNNGVIADFSSYPVEAVCDFKIIKKGTMLYVMLNGTASNGQKRVAIGSSIISNSNKTPIYLMASIAKAARETNSQATIRSKKQMIIDSIYKI